MICPRCGNITRTVQIPDSHNQNVIVLTYEQCDGCGYAPPTPRRRERLMVDVVVMQHAMRDERKEQER